MTVTGGAGYGSTAQTGYNKGVLHSWLRDTKVDGARTYARGYGDASADFAFESGRRSDGGSAFAKLADKAFTSPYPYGVAQYRYQMRVCMDLPWKLDPCSAVTNWHYGL